MFSVIVPVYVNEAFVSDLLARLERLHGRLPGGVEAVIVIDGSSDRSMERLAEALPRMPFPSQLLLLSRNFGSFSAIQAGLQHARGEHFTVMSADLQEPEELVVSFHAQLAADECDVVVGRREGRADRLVSRLLATLFWQAYRRLVQPEIPTGGIDIFGCNRVFRDHLLALRESHSSLVGLMYWLGFRRHEVPYRRLPREHGRSAWSLRRRVHYMLDSVFAFSYLPIRLMELTGVLGLLLGIVLSIVVVYTRLRNGVVVPGYTATVLTVVFFGALNALGIGVLGEYIARIYAETKRRPLWLVDYTLNLEEPVKEVAQQRRLSKFDEPSNREDSYLPTAA